MKLVFWGLWITSAVGLIRFGAHETLTPGHALDMKNQPIYGLPEPTSPTHATSRSYVDAAVGSSGGNLVTAANSLLECNLKEITTSQVGTNVGELFWCYVLPHDAWNGAPAGAPHHAPGFEVKMTAPSGVVHHLVAESVGLRYGWNFTCDEIGEWTLQVSFFSKMISSGRHSNPLSIMVGSTGGAHPPSLQVSCDGDETCTFYLEDVWGDPVPNTYDSSEVAVGVMSNGAAVTPSASVFSGTSGTFRFSFTSQAAASCNDISVLLDTAVATTATFTTLGSDGWPALDCKDVKNNWPSLSCTPALKSGKFFIQPSTTKIQAYCNHDLDGGGWTLVASNSRLGPQLWDAGYTNYPRIDDVGFDSQNDPSRDYMIGPVIHNLTFSEVAVDTTMSAGQVAIKDAASTYPFVASTEKTATTLVDTTGHNPLGNTNANYFVFGCVEMQSTPNCGQVVAGACVVSSSSGDSALGCYFGHDASGCSGVDGEGFYRAFGGNMDVDTYATYVR